MFKLSNALQLGGGADAETLQDANEFLLARGKDLFAVLTQTTDDALAYDGLDRVRDEIGLDARCEQVANSASCAGGVEACHE